MMIMHRPESDWLRSAVVTWRSVWPVEPAKWITGSWWKKSVPRCHFRNSSTSQHWSVLDHLHLISPNLFHLVLSASKSSNKEHVGVFWEWQPVTASALLCDSFWRIAAVLFSEIFVTLSFYLNFLAPSCQPYCIWNDLSTMPYAYVQGCLLAQPANRSVRGWVYMLNSRSSAARLVLRRLLLPAFGDQVSSNILPSYLEQSSNLTVWSFFTHWPREIICLASAWALVPF